MEKPLAELDPRFSDPDAEPTSWEATLAILEAAELWWISTVRKDGRPHVTPLVAVWLDDAVHFCTGPHEQKAVNLASHPYLVLTTGCNRWDQGIDVTIEGSAERVTDHARLEDLAAAWAMKWDGRWRFEPRDGAFFHEDGGTAHVYRVVPTKILAFGKGRFSHTRYRR